MAAGHGSEAPENLDTSEIRNWRSIVTLVVFIVTNIIVLFPFHIPVFVPRPVINFIVKVLAALRVIPPRGNQDRDAGDGKLKRFVRFNVPVNFVTAPLIADLFLLAILAIGRREVHDGTIGANNIAPIDIMVFFITLAYIAISIDASGLIRFLAFKVLQKGGKVGHRLFFYLYAFFFSLGTFVGNDPIILSGTAFLAYMTRVSSNIVHPRAWIYSQFAVANIASAILVSSNPTNLVLAGAFGIKFLEYTANMIVPVVVTAIVLFPFLLYIVFADEKLIPLSIKMHELSQEAKEKKPVNPNIPNARVSVEDEESNAGNDEQGKLLSLEEIMNPFLDKKGAGFGAVVMAATLITVLALNAASQSGSERPVFWVTLPAAFVMLCWDIAFGWYHRNETREIARKGRLEMENARAERTMREQQESKRSSAEQEVQGVTVPTVILTQSPRSLAQSKGYIDGSGSTHDMPVHIANALNNNDFDITEIRRTEGKLETAPDSRPTHTPSGSILGAPAQDLDEEKQSSPVRTSCKNSLRQQSNQPTTLVSLFADAYRWSQETFPTATAVMSHLPFALVPFSFCMFVLVQALVTKGWVAVFAHGWDAWVEKTGTVGSIGGMGFLSVILCNFAGTNIGTTILLSRVIQAWQQIHHRDGTPISDRTFWATVYSMALGVNYGAFSTAFSASLAGLLWRDILSRKHIRVRSLDFARVNLPIIAIAMAVGCTVLIGEIYIIRDVTPYEP